MWTFDEPPPLVLGAIAGAGELAFSRSCESAREWECWPWERDPGKSCAGPRAKELVPEESFSVNIASRFCGAGVASALASSEGMRAGARGVSSEKRPWLLSGGRFDKGGRGEGGRVGGRVSLERRPRVAMSVVSAVLDVDVDVMEVAAALSILRHPNPDGLNESFVATRSSPSPKTFIYCSRSRIIS